MDALKFMRDMGIETDFELSIINTSEGLTTTIHGNRLLIDAALMTLVVEMAEQQDTTVREKLEEMLAIESLKYPKEEEGGEPEGCDGDCENCGRHSEMPDEVKALFDTLFINGEDEE